MVAARLTSTLHALEDLPLAKRGRAALERALDTRQVDLPPALAADRHQIETADVGTLSYYADPKASGRPLVLLHGVHAAASAYEMGPLFDAFRGKRKVYALDLPGFGFSERSARAYTPETYVHAIEHLLRHVTTREPADVIAASLTSEYAARVAVQMPELVRSLVLLSPTGFAAEKQVRPLELVARRARQRLSPRGDSLAGRLFYELLVSKPSLRWFLRRSFETRVDPGLLSYAYATSHQPGAWRAPLSFVSGALFPTGDAQQRSYGHVHAPTLVLYDQDAYTSFGELAPFTREHPSFRAQRVPQTRGLPQFDAREQTLEALRAFYAELDAQHYQGGLGQGSVIGGASRFLGSA
jgi:pimeloyl-ACP methyl ester carboxylesterase